jgi:L-2-hydroxycarboxylate dehydrogenase (NAD+)
MKNTPFFLPVDLVKAFIKETFMALGVPKEDANVCSEVMIASDLRGIESHGIGRLRYYYDRMVSGQHKSRTTFSVISDNPTTAVVDGNHGLGMVIGKRAMQMAIEKARKYGMGSVAVRNSTHFGIAGYYSLMAVNEGMIGFTVTNARPATCPTFGTQAMLGTNPIAFGAPTDEPFPFLFDAATPIIQRGKVETLARKEKSLMEGYLIDSQNKPLTDPKEILAKLTKDEAAFLPLGGIGESYGGHKGYGLATMVEVLSASLQSGVFLRALSGVGEDGSLQPFKVGHFFMAIDIESFVNLEDFKRSTGQIMRELRDSRKAPGQERIYTAGEKEYYKEIELRKFGVEIVPNLQKDLIFIKDQLKLNNFHFPF